MNIIDGKEIAKKLKEQISAEVKTFKKPPGLAVILIGSDPASAIYVRSKNKASDAVGFYSKKIKKPADISEAELLFEINKLNNDDSIDGILVQLPLPKHINAEKVITTINPQKDIDGFHSENIGKLMQNMPFLRPCTPKGIMTMLKAIGIDLVSKNAVIVGASNIVGRPMAMELLNARATVTICNSKTKNLKKIVKQADIVVVAVGIAKMIDSDYIKKNAVVIDVGINRLDNGKIVGDVDFTSVKTKASWITPVPGGVGPMTIATLLENTLIAYKSKKKIATKSS